MKKRSIKAKNLFIYFLSFSASGCGILLNFILARFLEAEQFGSLQYLIAVATTISQLLIIGMNSFLIREAKNELQKDVFDKCLTLFFLIIIFFLPIIFYVLNNFILLFYSNQMVVVLVIAISVLMGLNSLIASFFQGKGKFHITLIFENLLPKMLLLVLSIIFVLLNLKQQLYNNYLVFYVILYFLISIPLFFSLFRGFKLTFSLIELKSIFFFFGVTITYSLGNNLTKIIQGGLYKNNIALGIISVSLSIVGLVKVFTSVLDNMVKPLFAKKKRENDLSGVIDTYRFDTRMNSYIAIPLYLFFILHAEKFLLIFGKSYTVYPFILVFICLANAISDLTGPNGTLLAMTGNEKWELFNGFIYFSFYVLFVYLFSFDKIYGLSIALFLGQLFVNVAKYIEVWKIYKMAPLNAKTILTLILVLFVNATLIILLCFVKVPLLLWMAIGIAVGIVCVVLNCFVLSLYKKQDFKTLISLKI